MDADEYKTLHQSDLIRCRHDNVNLLGYCRINRINILIMIVSEVIKKLALELSFETGDLEDIKIYKKYLQRALSIGIEHYTKDMEEIIAMDHEGTEIGRFKSVTDASEKLGIHQNSISAVLTGVQHSTGGMLFVRLRDLELKLRKEDDNETILTGYSKVKLND